VTTPGLAQESGRASATRSDGLSLNGHDYQLFGIDGFAFNQSCFVDGQPFACGVSATRALQTLLEPAAITCAEKGTSEAGATLATCTGHDGDIALKLVEQGWALADSAESGDYAAAEATARGNHAGAWHGMFLTPKAYREQVAAIETRYAERAGEAARVEAEAAITAGEIELRGLDAVTFEAGADGASVKDYEVHFGAFAPGFIDAATRPPSVFEWKTVAAALEATRQGGIAAVKASVTDAIWDELAARPSQSVETHDADDFHAALTSSAAGWIADGRQPILFVMAPDLPNWIRHWFAGQPPQGAEVSRRDDRRDPNYLGTIDGVDVYVGPGRKRAALLVPSDILAGVTYRKGDGDAVLALQVKTDGSNEWVWRYGMTLHWRDDAVTWLTFPQMAAPTPDAG
jgi:endonuclease YncB( thermonuclease family)